MNFSGMKTQVRMFLGESDADNSNFTDTEIDTQINISLLRMASEIPTLLTYKEVATVSGTQTYALPTDFLQLKDVQLIKSATQRTSLVRLTYDEFEAMCGSNTTMTGTPAYYRMELGAVSIAAGSPPGDLWLWPVPDDNGGANYTVRIVYYQKPTALTNTTDVSELPEFIHELACYHAAWHMSIKTDSQSKINNLLYLYETALAKAKKTANKFDRSGSHQMKTAYSSPENTHGKWIRRGPIR